MINVIKLNHVIKLNWVSKAKPSALGEPSSNGFVCVHTGTSSFGVGEMEIWRDHVCVEVGR